MKRGEIYFNRYIDMDGRHRRIPSIVVSGDEYNASSDFVTCVRMVRTVNGIHRPTHIPVPLRSIRFSENCPNALSDGVVIAEGVSSVRKENMVGPVGIVADQSVMDEISEAIRRHVCADTTPDADGFTKAVPPTRDCPWYSPQIQKEQQMRMTEPAYGYDGKGIMTMDRTDAGSRRFGPNSGEGAK